MVEHLVLFKFNESCTEERHDELLNKILAFKGRIPGLVELTAGRNVTKETDNIRGYTLALRATFEDQAALDGYGPHPVHQEFVASLAGLVDSVIVADYPVRD